MYDRHVKHVGNMFGICGDYAWVRNCVTNIHASNKHGRCTQIVHNVWTRCKEHGCGACKICAQYVRNLYGLSMECKWSVWNADETRKEHV